MMPGEEMAYVAGKRRVLGCVRKQSENKQEIQEDDMAVTDNEHDNDMKLSNQGRLYQ